MYICLCNPFSDHDVREHLETLDEPARVGDVYKSCSGGAGFHCGSCACALKKMVDAHNNTLTVQRLSDDIARVAQSVETM